MQVEGLFQHLNGFLIPGGAADLRPGHSFYDTATLIFKLARKANDRGDHFPIMGICLGFETMMLIVAGTEN
jgi:gamma-glutamyl hydrolase